MRKGRLITPAVTENVLEGITRDSVMELAARELGLEIVERPIDRSELYVCDELFLTGTAVGVAPVMRVDHRPVADGAIGAVTRRLRQLYFDATHGRMPAYRKWLLPVYRRAQPPERGEVRTAGNELGLSPCRRRFTLPTTAELGTVRRRGPGKEETPNANNSSSSKCL